MIMGLPSGNYNSCLSNTRLLMQSVGCGDHHQEELMLERKKRRLESNRESARRSRKKKQKYMDDMVGQVVELRKENSELVAGINMVTLMSRNVEAENSILKAQIVELTQTLRSLNHVIELVNTRTMVRSSSTASSEALNFAAAPEMNPMNMLLTHNQPLIACADIFGQW